MEGKAINSNISNSQFKSTKLWKSIVDDLLKSITIKDRRYFLRTYENSFTGSEAVDVVFRFLSKCHGISTNCDRSNAVKVCQKMLATQIFVPSSSKFYSSKKAVFEDSTSRFYRLGDNSCSVSKADSFTPLFNTSTRSADGHIDEPLVLSNFRNCKPRTSVDVEEPFKTLSRTWSLDPQQRKKYNLLDRMRKYHNVPENKDNCSLLPSKRESVIKKAPTLKRNWTTTNLTPRKRPTLRKEEPIHADISCYKQQLLVKLLSMIDIQFVEDILLYLQQKDIASGAECLFFENGQEDWLIHAKRCINSSLPFEHEDICIAISTRKRIAFKAVVNYFIQRAESLISHHWKEVLISVVKLHQEAKFYLAVQVLQLLLLMLHVSRKNKLHSLLSFMQIMITDSTVSLEKAQSNQFSVTHQLHSAIIPACEFKTDESITLVSFMVQHCDIIFSTSHELHGISSCRKRSKRPVDRLFQKQAITYCNQMSPSSFRHQTHVVSEDALMNLMDSHIGPTSTLTEEEKSVWLKKFHKIHPTIHFKYRTKMRRKLNVGNNELKLQFSLND